MNKLRLIVIALAGVCALAFGVFALANKTTEPAPPSGPVIIIKGGSLTIDCGEKQACLDAPVDGVYSHKNKAGKIESIVVKDDDSPKAKTLDTIDKSKFPNGKPVIEITYK